MTSRPSGDPDPDPDPPLDRFTTAGGRDVEVRRHPDAGRPGVPTDAQLVRVVPPRDPLDGPRDPTQLTAADRVRVAAARSRAAWYRDASAYADVAYLLDLVDRLTRPRPPTEEEPPP